MKLFKKVFYCLKEFILYVCYLENYNFCRKLKDHLTLCLKNGYFLTVSVECSPALQFMLVLSSCPLFVGQKLVAWLLHGFEIAIKTM